jgi:hypothetical protein
MHAHEYYGLISLAIAIGFVFVLFKILRNSNFSVLDRIARIAKIIATGLLYAVLAGLSSMGVAGCTVNDCPMVTILTIGNSFLFTSYAAFIYLLYRTNPILSPWRRIFYPYLTLPIFFAIVVIGMYFFNR